MVGENEAFQQKPTTRQGKGERVLRTIVLGEKFKIPALFRMSKICFVVDCLDSKAKATGRKFDKRSDFLSLAVQQMAKLEPT